MAETDKSLIYGKLQIYPVGRAVYIDGNETELTRMEFDVLYFLASNPNIAFTKEQIYYAEVTKLADMAEKEMTDELRERYAALLVTGEDCVHCGSCTRRCPFGIDASENMRRAQRIFGC